MLWKNRFYISSASTKVHTSYYVAYNISWFLLHLHDLCRPLPLYTHPVRAPSVLIRYQVCLVRSAIGRLSLIHLHCNKARIYSGGLAIEKSLAGQAAEYLDSSRFIRCHKSVRQVKSVFSMEWSSFHYYEHKFQNHHCTFMYIIRIIQA